jgi:peptidyl-prolyl cis-trans isomerase A (cyclophilin A)
MKNIFLISLLLFCCLSCKQYAANDPHIEIETAQGDITLQLFPDKAPKTVAAFLKYVEAGHYKESNFYRVIKNENVPAEYNTGLIQGGIFHSNPALHQQLKGTEHESPRVTGLSHTSGTISMARTTPGSATSEFFICVGDQQQFDSSSRVGSDGLGYAAFGKVVEGMDVLSKIQNKKSNGESFIEKVRIINIRRL